MHCVSLQSGARSPRAVVIREDIGCIPRRQQESQGFCAGWGKLASAVPGGGWRWALGQTNTEQIFCRILRNARAPKRPRSRESGEARDYVRVGLGLETAESPPALVTRRRRQRGQRDEASAGRLRGQAPIPAPETSRDRPTSAGIARRMRAGGDAGGRSETSAGAMATDIDRRCDSPPGGHAARSRFQSWPDLQSIDTRPTNAPERIRLVLLQLPIGGQPSLDDLVGIEPLTLNPTAYHASVVATRN